MTPYLHPFACFACRRCFRRRAAGAVARTCPACGSTAVAMNRKFKAPSQADEDQWRKVVFLYEHGFRFQSVYDDAGRRVPYPDTLEEAQAFVRRHRVTRRI